MSAKSYLNIAQAARDVSARKVMIGKVRTRLTERRVGEDRAANLTWLEERCQDFESYASGVDPDLWAEAREASQRLERRAQAALAQVSVGLGGGGHYPLLYFMARHLRAGVVVETGVAAGYSSQILLEALERNQHGRLFSSDFPYFRIQDPAKYIGILVEERLKHRWQLHTRGDELNLPAILDQVGAIDIFHYDSDKSISGRAFALDLVTPRMKTGGLVVMDDIQDNSFFRSKVEREGIAPFHVYKFGGKYVGMYTVS